MAKNKKSSKKLSVWLIVVAALLVVLCAVYFIGTTRQLASNSDASDWDSTLSLEGSYTVLGYADGSLVLNVNDCGSTTQWSNFVSQRFPALPGRHYSGSVTMTSSAQKTVYLYVRTYDENGVGLHYDLLEQKVTLMPGEEQTIDFSTIKAPKGTREAELLIAFGYCDENDSNATNITISDVSIKRSLGSCKSNDAGHTGYTLAWSDEFDGDELDTTKWAYQLGTGAQYGLSGWGNSEAECYTEDNVSVEDGYLVLELRFEDTLDEVSGITKDYSSGRIRTVSDDETLFATTYGRIEARMSLPDGDGIWPAFWMLPTDDTPYGGWAASGEIDIMEARGRLPEKVGAAVHFGGAWPANQYVGGDYYFAENEDITGFHVYALEWEPGKLTWLCDGVEYYSFSLWESAAGEWPAPFDVDFYILLNLAVGGTFDQYAMPDNETDIPARMLVDYVRVYTRDEGYDENVEYPDVTALAIDNAAYSEYKQHEDEKGNYIKDTDFAAMDTTCITDAPTVELGKWEFLALSSFGGTATCSIEENDGTNFAFVDVGLVGNQNYAIQLIQYVPVAYNCTYEVEFTAYATAERQIASKVSGDDDNGWAVYSKVATFDLTTEPTTYTYRFTMAGVSDPTARLEFELGLNSPDVYIGDVSFTIVN